jgi:hypothetical protein
MSLVFVGQQHGLSPDAEFNALLHIDGTFSNLNMSEHILACLLNTQTLNPKILLFFKTTRVKNWCYMGFLKYCPFTFHIAQAMLSSGH